MKLKLLLQRLCLGLSPFAMGLSALAQGTAFTYQGRLNDGAGPATGIYDFRFVVYDALSGGNPIGEASTNAATALSNGLFTVALDFGPGVFTGANRWLEIGVRTNAGASFATLAPRQLLTPTPYAISAANLMSPFTTPLDLTVGGQRALRLEPNGTSPNLIGGFGGNSADPGVTGAVIGGGGTGTIEGTNGLNRVTDHFGVVSGGAANRAGNANPDPSDARYAAVGGGFGNTASGLLSTVGGGNRNLASGISATVGGGSLNSATNNDATVAGGLQNTASFRGAVAGGQFNAALGNYAAVGGGFNNQNAGVFSAIGGGQNSSILEGADHSTIGGGGDNTIIGSAALPVYATIGGGRGNLSGTNASYSTVGGGLNNQATGLSATVGGGSGNQATNNDATVAGGLGNIAGYRGAVGGGEGNRAVGGDSTVGGGLNNQATGLSATVGGGSGNQATNNDATVAGGFGNTAGYRDAVGGGEGNRAVGGNSFVGGGFNNLAAGPYSAIPGGNGNVAVGYASFAGGINTRAWHSGAFVWADVSGGEFASTAPNQFLIRALGGVGIGTTNPQAALDVAGTVRVQSLVVGSNAVAPPVFGPTLTAGLNNTNQGLVGFIGGGIANVIRTNSFYSAVVAGQRNLIESDLNRGFIGGGTLNYLSADDAFIGSGQANTNQGGNGVVVGGFANQNGANDGFIGAGGNNRIEPAALDASIVGGYQNLIRLNGGRSAIVGGARNAIGTDTQNAFIGGGQRNTNNGAASAIVGGAQNIIRTNADIAFIGGGTGNTVDEGAFGSVISGGGQNRNAATWGVVAGGIQNVATTSLGSVGGGSNNFSGGLGSVIGGGVNNTASGPYSVVPGGVSNSASGPASLAAGTLAQASHAGSFVWADQQGATFASTADNQFLIRAGGGVGIGTATPQAALDVLGTLRASSLAIGSNQNLASAFTTISGGRGNAIAADSDFASIAGGLSNRVVSFGAHVGGGYQNLASGFNTVVGGGSFNRATNNDATVAGGFGNTAGYRAAITGGEGNQAVGDWSAVGGGFANTNAGIAGFIGGGSNNLISASALRATIGGGEFNRVNGGVVGATVAGGRGNLAGGTGATVPGGQDNVAGGDYSFAAGRNAHATHAGSFVWGDGSQAANSTADNRFEVLASGGANFNTGASRIGLGNSAGLDFGAATRQMLNLWGTNYGIGVQGGALYFRTDAVFAPAGFTWFKGGAHNNAQWDPGGGTELMRLDGSGNLKTLTGVIGTLSDRNAKTNFAAVDPQAILERVAALPISTWNFKSADPSQRHIGPMAQDFHAAFEVGLDERSICTVDADGVALAAIQGLNQKLDAASRESGTRLRKLEAENAELRHTVQELRHLVEALLQKGATP